MTTKITKAVEINTQNLDATNFDGLFYLIYIGLGTAPNKNNPSKPLEFFRFCAKDVAAPKGAKPLTFRVFSSRYLSLADGEALMPKGKVLAIFVRMSESTAGITYYNVVGFDKLDKSPNA